VVGAGIVGCACALELARGHRSVLLLEAGQVAGETSCRAMGWVGIYDEGPAETELCRFALSLWEELAPSLPPSVEYRRPGALWLAPRPQDLRRAEEKRNRLRSVGVRAEVLNEEELFAAEPSVRHGLAGAVLVPDDVVLDAPGATHELARRARVEGVEIRTETPVASLVPRGVRLGDGTAVEADHVVLAAGWKSPALLPGLPVRPRKGTILRTLARPGLVRHQLAELDHMEEVRAGSDDALTLGVQPRANGQYLLGTTRQHAGTALTVDPALVARIVENVVRFVPSMREVGIETSWSGLRPAGPDAVPIIGPWPAEPSWILATGHEGIGITTSLATGRLVAEMIEGARTSIPVEPYLPDRLARPGASSSA
jgi:glycine/D-amino acid oxidase-like deaminating enzyme